MARRESKKLKALYFDLMIKELKIHYSETDPTGAYRKIKSFFNKTKLFTRAVFGIPLKIQDNGS